MDHLLDAAGQTLFLVSLVSVALIMVIISIKQTMHQESKQDARELVCFPVT